MRAMPGDNLPSAVSTYIYFSEPPIVFKLRTLSIANSNQLAGYDSRVSVNLNPDVGSPVDVKLHLSRFPDCQRFFLIHHRHIRNGNEKIFGPKLLQRIRITLQMSIVPNLFEPGKFLDVGFRRVFRVTRDE